MEMEMHLDQQLVATGHKKASTSRIFLLFGGRGY
jgi:hypothetical protein